MTPSSRTWNTAVLAAAWQWWADALDALDPGGWSRPTRCEGWTVHALAVHTAPDVDALSALPQMAAPGPAAFDDAARVLAAFNQPDGPARTMAPELERMAVERARALPPAEVVERFRRGAAFANEATDAIDPTLVVPYPVAGTLTVAAVVDIAVLEATVHGLDLAAATAAPPPPAEALAVTRDLLVRMADPVAVIEAATGRSPNTPFPLLR